VADESTSTISSVMYVIGAKTGYGIRTKISVVSLISKESILMTSDVVK